MLAGKMTLLFESDSKKKEKEHFGLNERRKIYFMLSVVGLLKR